jgi:hypothetical protein
MGGDRTASLPTSGSTFGGCHLGCAATLAEMGYFRQCFASAQRDGKGLRGGGADGPSLVFGNIAGMGRGAMIAATPDVACYSGSPDPLPQAATIQP